MNYTHYCALTFDGKLLDQLIPGYITANVEGRGILPRSIQTTNVPAKDGLVILGQTLPPRRIKVHYQLKGVNSKQFMDRLHALHDALYSAGDVLFKFGDEDWHRFGRLDNAQDPPYNAYNGMGSFELLCADPYKYKPLVTITGNKPVVPAGSRHGYKVDSITFNLTAAHASGITINNTTTGRLIKLTGAFASGNSIAITPTGLKVNNANSMHRIDYAVSDWLDFFYVPAASVFAAPGTSVATIKLAERSL